MLKLEGSRLPNPMTLAEGTFFFFLPGYIHIYEALNVYGTTGEEQAGGSGLRNQTVIMFPPYIMETESENGEHPSPKRFRYRFVLGVAS